MKESSKNNIIKPGLEEALHPEIGNDAFWENNEHSISLSTVDPSKSLDQNILEEAISQKIIEQWKMHLNDKSIDQDLTSQEEMRTSIESEPTEQAIGTTAETAVLKTFGEQRENISQPEPHQEEVESKKEKKKKEKAGIKVSKRIRKVAEKLKKEEEKSQEAKPKITSSPPEANLSPFTNWLKGLSGSEYVHPYEDDFAFNQGSSHAGEGISETFADLLAAQGYKDQAIAMYTRLMEKFPEKSRFFAAKIEALQ